MITLQLIEKYGPDGWQDEMGVEWFDDTFDTPYGPLGNLSVEKVDGEWVIKETPGVVLFNRKFCEDLLSGRIEDECTTASTSPLGLLKTIRISASNGISVYQLHEDELRWSDKPDAVNCLLATLSYQDWANADD